MISYEGRMGVISQVLGTNALESRTPPFGIFFLNSVLRPLGHPEVVMFDTPTHHNF